MPTTQELKDFANSTAVSFGIDPNVFAFQLGQESSWNPNAYNVDPKTGTPAIGIAQFQPATAAQYGIDPSDPFQAITGAAKFDSDLLNKNGGDYTKMLRSYGTLNSSVPQSIWDRAKAAIQGATGFGQGNTNIGQNCSMDMGIDAYFSCMNSKLRDMSGLSNKGSQNQNSECDTMDIGCYIKKYGSSLLAIVLGIVLITGALLIYRGSIAHGTP